MIAIQRHSSSSDAAAAFGDAYTTTGDNVLNYVCGPCVNFLCDRGVYPPPPVLRRQNAAHAAASRRDDNDGSRCTFAAHAAAAAAVAAAATPF